MRLNVLLAVLAAAVLAVFVVLYFVMSGGSGDEAENGLTIEEQTPRIEQKSEETPKETADETSAPAGQEESPVSDDAEAEESAASSDESESAGSTQPDAPQAASQDPFTVELQDAVSEFDSFWRGLADNFPNSKAAQAAADAMSNIAADLVRYDAQLSSQSLGRDERAAMLRQRFEQENSKISIEIEGIIEKHGDLLIETASEEEQALDQYVEANMPKKLITLLSLDW